MRVTVSSQGTVTSGLAHHGPARTRLVTSRAASQRCGEDSSRRLFDATCTSPGLSSSKEGNAAEVLPLGCLHAGHQAIIVPTCEARLATLKRDVSPSVIQSLKLMPAALSHIVSTLLHGPVLASSTLEPSLFPHGRWPQDQLHDRLHVFLC